MHVCVCVCVCACVCVYRKQSQVSKEKDDHRGAKVIRDYSEAHSPASEDGFVKETHKVSAELKAEVEALVAKL